MSSTKKPVPFASMNDADAERALRDDRSDDAALRAVKRAAFTKRGPVRVTCLTPDSLDALLLGDDPLGIVPKAPPSQRV